MFVNLVTGATLPDSGEVRVFGFDTAAITDGDEWLRTLDRFGILSDRAVLLDELTVAQNLAMTLTLAIDPIPADVRGRVEALASEAGLEADLIDRKVATLTPAAKLRVPIFPSAAERQPEPASAQAPRPASSHPSLACGLPSSLSCCLWP